MVLANYIKKCAELFYSSTNDDAPKYYSPYITIVQSSGYGKTALVLQVAAQIKSYYICLRSKGSTGEPMRTAAVANSKYFCGAGEENKEEAFKALFKKLTHTAKTFTSASELLMAQNILNPVKNKSFWNSLLHDCSEATGAPPSPSDLILLIIDEAASMKSGNDDQDVYLSLRRALQDKSFRIFCIMIDTNSKISTFAPTDQDDPSSRIVEGTQLFHPWTCIPTMDIRLELPPMVSTYCETIFCDEQKVFQYNRFDILRQSRPLFIRALLLSNAPKNCPGDLWNDLIAFTCKKLFGRECSKLDTAVTVLAGRYSLIPVDIMTQEALVANRMATLHNCSVSRERMEVSYEPEPVLGEGLACRMAKQFKTIMKTLSKLMASGKVSCAGNQGDYGELVAAIALSRAYDVLHENHFSRPVMVKKMLALFDITSCTIHKQKTRLSPLRGKKSQPLPPTSSGGLRFSAVLGSLVSFLQFIRLSKPLSKEMLGKGFRKRVAFFTPTNTPACDLVIPILLLSRRKEGAVSSIYTYAGSI